jgi:hypothetical protein
MDDFRKLAQDPAHRRRFERLLYLSARHGDADLVAERLSWGIDPNCTFSQGRTPMIANVCGSCPSGATIRVLLERGADPSLADDLGLTALHSARRKLARLQNGSHRPGRRSPSLDENGQLRLSAAEQEELDKLRRQFPDTDREPLRIWWQERSRAARRVFNDPTQIEEIVTRLEAVEGHG